MFTKLSLPIYAHDLVAFGNAVPPPWVRTSAAAELWAVMLVLSINLMPPENLRDCMSILTTAAQGAARATAPSCALAAIWSLISVVVEEDLLALVTTKRLKWMPSHTSLDTLLDRIKSDGRPISTVEWRANRLADALAKAAAGDDSVCGGQFRGCLRRQRNS